MTSELEQEFFRVFGIEQRDCGFCTYDLGLSCPYCEDPCITSKCPWWNTVMSYPEITDRRLLEMICINSQKGGIEIFNRKNIEELKNSMLQHCIERLGYALNKEKYKQQIQQLFEGEE